MMGSEASLLPTGRGITHGSLARAPRLGFLGVGWIGRNRMRALIESGAGVAAVVADTDSGLRVAAAEDAPDAAQAEDLEGLLEHDLDGVVIATPSALHAEQAVRALAAGLPVFCQKPLGRDAAEAEAVVAAARRADRLIRVDFSYRFTTCIQAMKQQLDAGAIGDVYALDLTFHNAYGPDKAWFKRRDLAGGGCLIDLGTHVLDLALWLTGSTMADVLSAHVLKDGKPLDTATSEVEDLALADLRLGSGAMARLACSWWLDAGRDCAFEVTLFGTDGALSMRDVGGSFYDFDAQLLRGTSATALAGPPDDWGGRALEEWAKRLAQDRSFDPAADELVSVSHVIDAIYAGAR